MLPNYDTWPNLVADGWAQDLSWTQRGPLAEFRSIGRQASEVAQQDVVDFAAGDHPRGDRA